MRIYAWLKQRPIVEGSTLFLTVHSCSLKGVSTYLNKKKKTCLNYHYSLMKGIKVKSEFVVYYVEKSLRLEVDSINFVLLSPLYIF